MHIKVPISTVCPTSNMREFSHFYFFSGNVEWILQNSSNNWESIREYNVGTSQDMLIASMKFDPIALLCY